MDLPAAPPPTPRACRAFHVALVATLVFPVAAVGTFLLAVLEVWRADPDERERTWTRRLVGLALLDGLYLLAIIGWMNEGQDFFKALLTRPRPAELGLFEPMAPALSRWDWILPAAGLASVPAAAALGARRSPMLRTWGLLLAVLAGAHASELATSAALGRAFGGPTFGGGHVASLTAAFVLGFFALGSLRGTPATRLAPGTPPLIPSRAYLRGLFYFASGMLRLVVVLMTADLLLLREQGMFVAALRDAKIVQPGTAGTLLVMANAVFLRPLAEELLFRGWLLPRLAEGIGNTAAVWASAAVFAGFHLSLGVFAPVALLGGLVLGWARLRSGSLSAPLALHVSVSLLANATLLSG